MRSSDISHYQGTVTKILKFAGVGLHSGKLIELEVHPAPVNSGIRFLRTDHPDAKPVLAHPDNVSCSRLCTTIGEGHSRISTIEHLMAAFSGLGIDNALVTINASELPILDGSSAPFMDRLAEAGVQIQGARRKVLVPLKTITVKEGDQYIRFEPFNDRSPQSLAESPELDMVCSIDFPMSDVIGFQKTQIQFSTKSFMDLCEARTFCLESDIKKMWSQGLALGGSLDNAVVVGTDKVMNNDGLRYDDEFVRHKLLDCIGDLALLGARLSGRIVAHKAGHALHTELTRRILRSPLVMSFPETESRNFAGLDGMGLAAMARNDGC